MVQTTEYAHGTPSWVDLSSPDLAASRAFYSDLFGWTGEPDPAPEAMGYAAMMLGTSTVAGIGPLMGETPPWWNTYVTVDNVDEALATVAEADGQALMEAMDVFDAGRMGAVMDPSGAALMLWQPNQHIGAGVRWEPGSLCWVELNTRDPEGAKAFYGRLFGWDFREMPIPATGDMPEYVYTQLFLGDTPVGGMIVMDEHWPADVPPHWMVYFGVEDCDATAEKVTELGGAVCVPPTDILPGRFAVVNDAHGATFTIIAMDESMTSEPCD